MQKAQAGMDAAAQKVSQGNMDPGNFVDMMSNQRLYEANAKMLKMADERVGTLLDVLA